MRKNNNFQYKNFYSSKTKLLNDQKLTFQIYDNDHYVISGPYSIFDENMKKLLKEYSSFFNHNERGWIIKKIFYKSVIDKIKKCFSNLIINEIPDIAIKSLEKMPENIVFKHEKENILIKYSPSDSQKQVNNLPQSLYKSLYKFQEIGIEFAIKNNCRVLIADEMGVGKTIQAISLSYLYKENWPCLIICPSSLRLNWRDEIKKWLNRDVKNFEIQIITKSNCTIKKEATMVIISYDLCAKMMPELENKNFGIAIADEAHYLKNSLAKRTEILSPLLQRTKHVLLLTGTPAFAKPKELFTLLQILRPDIFRFFKDFGNRYCDPKPSKWTKGIDFEGSSNVRELHYILTTNIMIRRLKKDVLSELPSKRRQKVEINVDSKISQEIIKLLNKSLGLDEYLENAMEINKNIANLVNNMMSFEDQTEAPAQLTRNEINEVLNRCYLLTGLAKIKGIRQYISEIIENDAKFLIFAHHLEVLDGIEAEVQTLKLKYVRIDGNTSQNKRHDYVQNFQEDSEIKIAILSISATGVGLTLTAASTIIFAEMHWTPAMMLQAEDRAHRIGQINSVNCHYLYGEGTLDDKLYFKLEKKLGVVSEVLDGLKKDLEVEEQLKIGTMGNVSINKIIEKQIKKKNVDVINWSNEKIEKEKITDFFPVVGKKKSDIEKKKNNDESDHSCVSDIEVIEEIIERFNSKKKEIHEEQIPIKTIIETENKNTENKFILNKGLTLNKLREVFQKNQCLNNNKNNFPIEIDISDDSDFDYVKNNENIYEIKYDANSGKVHSSKKENKNNIIAMKIKENLKESEDCLKRKRSDYF